MTISLTCPNCGKSGKIPDEFVGRNVKCPRCKQDFSIAKPSLPTATPSLPEPSQPKANEMIETKSAVRPCPFCAEDIRVEATKCKHCGEIVDPALKAAIDAKQSAEQSLRELQQDQKQIKLSTDQILGLIGVALLVLGLFTPAFSAPIVGDMSFIRFFGHLDVSNASEREIVTVISLFLIVVTTGLSLFYTLRREPGMITSGVLTLGAICFAAAVVYDNLKHVQEQMGENNKIGQAIMGAIHWQWGWAVLIIGASLVVVGGKMKEKTASQHVAKSVSTNPAVTKANFDRIEKGLTRSEVDAIFRGEGELLSVNNRVSVIAWDGDDGSSAHIAFLDDSVTDATWHDSDETLFEKIRRWFSL